MILICMGVSGCGKTTIGRRLAGELGLPFYDADDFHPEASVKKMSSGLPLSDADRKPWLNRLANEISGWEQTGGAVLACSALKASYREMLQRDRNDIRFIYLKGDRRLITRRMKTRENHYMPPELLDSQYDILEEPSEALTVSIAQPPEKIVGIILRQIREQQ